MKKAIWLISIVAFILTGTLPAEALAFELAVTQPTKQPLVALVNLAGRDSYLSLAINNLPEYDFSDSGSVNTAPSPVTVRSRIATPTPVSLALAPQPAPTPVPPAPPDGGPAVVMEGEASYYSRAGCLGCDPQVIMANGQPLNDGALTMAIGADKKQFVGRSARVTSLATGKSVVVRITDTGGFYQAKYGHRVADLTIATKQAIGMNGGVGQVRVEVY